MNALIKITFQRGLFDAGEPMISARLLRIAAIATGVLLVAYLILLADTLMLERTQRDLGSFEPAVSASDHQLAPLEKDLSTQQINTPRTR